MSHTPKPFDKNNFEMPEKPEYMPPVINSDGVGMFRGVGFEIEDYSLRNKDEIDIYAKAQEAYKESLENNNVEPPVKKPGGDGKDARDTVGKAGEAANKYKGIIQLGIIAVVIAGTVEAFVWGKN